MNYLCVQSLLRICLLFVLSLLLFACGWGYSEDSNATGLSGDQNDNSSTSTGAVYLY